VINNVYDYQMSLPNAVSAMRFHHQLLPPNTIFMEKHKPIEGELAKQLEAMGYVLETQDFNGDIQVIKIDGEHVEAVSDPRGTGVGKVM
jgi:gamma-glutamyltranspeptidase/glutathione hydrolase